MIDASARGARASTFAAAGQLAPAADVTDPIPYSAPRRVKKRRVLGILSLVFALLGPLSYLVTVAVVAAIIFAVPLVFSFLASGATPEGLGVVGHPVASAMPDIPGFRQGPGMFLILLLPFLLFFLLVYLSAFATAGLSILFGVIGLVRRSARVLCVIGISISVAMIAFNLFLAAPVFIDIPADG